MHEKRPRPNRAGRRQNRKAVPKLLPPATAIDIVTGCCGLIQSNITSAAEVTAANEFPIAQVTVTTDIDRHLVTVGIAMLAERVGMSGKP